MNFLELIQNLIDDTVNVSLPSFLPELCLVATIVLMLLLRIVSFNRGSDQFVKFVSAWLPLVGALAALAITEPWRYLAGDSAIKDPHLGHEIFTGFLIYDNFTIYFRGLLLLFVALFVVFTQLSGIPDREDAADFYTLILGGTLGMCLMASANHLLMIFLAVEMASVPSYALAGILKGRRVASEAAIKYAVYGAGASGIMLYGISLLAGVVGTCHLPTLASRLSEMIASGAFADRYMVLVLGGLMVMVGLAFKLSAFPFHFWCPDVFEGASAEVNAFLSVASKAAALALLVRVSVGLGFVPSTPAAVPASATAVNASSSSTGATALAEASTLPPAAKVLLASDSARIAKTPAKLALYQEGVKPADTRADQIRHLAPVRSFAAFLVGLLAAVTCTFGNLAAYGQTNIKRLLAYSTIAHAGYLMMPVAAAISIVGNDPSAAQAALSGMAFYIGTYLFMNLAAFAIVAFLRNAMGTEQIADYGGLIRTCPGVVVAFTLVLLSLIGLPPLVGFMAKVAIFYPLVETRQYALLIIGGLNTVVSLFYYLRVIKVMTLEPEPEHRLPVQFSMLSLAGVYVVAIVAPVVILGLFNNTLFEWTSRATASLFS